MANKLDIKAAKEQYRKIKAQREEGLVGKGNKLEQDILEAILEDIETAICAEYRSLVLLRPLRENRESRGREDKYHFLAFTAIRKSVIALLSERGFTVENKNSSVHNFYIEISGWAE